MSASWCLAWIETFGKRRESIAYSNLLCAKQALVQLRPRVSELQILAVVSLAVVGQEQPGALDLEVCRFSALDLSGIDLYPCSLCGKWWRYAFVGVAILGHVSPSGSLLVPRRQTGTQSNAVR